jgi:predicted alpha/beta hydrolase
VAVFPDPIIDVPRSISLQKPEAAVLAYGYRGIRTSNSPHLPGFAATTEDWAEYDCGGAIAYMRQQFPTADVVGNARNIAARFCSALLRTRANHRILS